FFSSRRRHTRSDRDWSSDVCSSDLRRAQRVLAALEQGVKLDEAVRAFDDNGEFHWRLTNATHARGGFLAALRGWHEALDAKAFQIGRASCRERGEIWVAAGG